MLERGVQHLVCSFSMNNFSRLVEVPFRTQTVQSGTCEMWKSVSRRMSTTKLISYPDLIDMSANPDIFSFRMNWNNCLQVLFFFEKTNLGRNAGNANLEAKPEQRWIESCIQASEASRFSESHTGDLAKRGNFEPVKSCFPLSFFRFFFENVL